MRSNMKSVRMLKRYEQIHAGEIGTFGAAVADRLVAAGHAEYLTRPPTTPKQKLIPKITKGAR